MFCFRVYGRILKVLISCIFSKKNNKIVFLSCFKMQNRYCKRFIVYPLGFGQNTKNPATTISLLSEVLGFRCRP
jgi:hypothetical protein